MRSWLLPTLVGVLALALAATGVVAAAQAQRAADERARADELAAEVEELRSDVVDLRDELDRAQASPDARPDAENGLDLGGMLDELLGGAIPGQECFAPGAGGLEGLFDGLFGGGSLPDDPDELVEVIADHVAQLRELEWQEPVQAEFLDSAGLHERLEALLDEDLDPAAIDASERLLVALGAIPPGSDLEALQRELLDDQVAGYYVPSTGELVVRVPDRGELRPMDKVTLAHELDHALTDQVLGIPDRSEPPYLDDADAALGVLAVVEGDATLVMNLWALAELPMSDQLAMAMDPGMAAAQAALDDVPAFLQRELLYPYTDGLEWACQRYLDGGWGAIDAAYADPPTTSAEVLWGTPVTPATTATTTSPDGFEELTATTFGAAHLLWLLDAPGDDPGAGLDDADGRAQAWSGGSVTVWGRGADTAVGLALVDGGGGSAPLCDTLEQWYLAAFPDATATSGGPVTTFDGDRQTAALRCDATDVVLGVAPDLATASAIAGP